MTRRHFGELLLECEVKEEGNGDKSLKKKKTYGGGKAKEDQFEFWSQSREWTEREADIFVGFSLGVWNSNRAGASLETPIT